MIANYVYLMAQMGYQTGAKTLFHHVSFINIQLNNSKKLLSHNPKAQIEQTLFFLVNEKGYRALL